MTTVSSTTLFATTKNAKTLLVALVCALLALATLTPRASYADDDETREQLVNTVGQFLRGDYADDDDLSPFEQKYFEIEIERNDELNASAGIVVSLALGSNDDSIFLRLDQAFQRAFIQTLAKFDEDDVDEIATALGSSDDAANARYQKVIARYARTWRDNLERNVFNKVEALPGDLPEWCEEYRRGEKFAKRASKEDMHLLICSALTGTHSFELAVLDALEPYFERSDEFDPNDPAFIVNAVKILEKYLALSMENASKSMENAERGISTPYLENAKRFRPTGSAAAAGAPSTNVSNSGSSRNSDDRDVRLGDSPRPRVITNDEDSNREDRRRLLQQRLERLM